MVVKCSKNFVIVRDSNPKLPNYAARVHKVELKTRYLRADNFVK